eukprot:SAG11_NODE_8872_length_967_cov_59.815668_2_plen_173_part_01
MLGVGALLFFADFLRLDVRTGCFDFVYWFSLLLIICAFVLTVLLWFSLLIFFVDFLCFCSDQVLWFSLLIFFASVRTGCIDLNFFCWFSLLRCFCALCFMFWFYSDRVLLSSLCSMLACFSLLFWFSLNVPMGVFLLLLCPIWFCCVLMSFLSFLNIYDVFLSVLYIYISPPL